MAASFWLQASGSEESEALQVFPHGVESLLQQLEGILQLLSCSAVESDREQEGDLLREVKEGGVEGAAAPQGIEMNKGGAELFSLFFHGGDEVVVGCFASSRRHVAHFMAFATKLSNQGLKTVYKFAPFL